MSSRPGWERAPAERHDMRTGYPIKFATAYALAVCQLSVVERAAIRALLPVGAVKAYSEGERRGRYQRAESTSSGSNRTTKKFQSALEDFEGVGWVQRGRVFVRVIDHAALLDYAVARLPDPLPDRFLDWEQGIAVVQSEAPLPDGGAAEARRRTLLAFERMMQETYRTSRKNRVVGVQRPRTI